MDSMREGTGRLDAAPLLSAVTDLLEQSLTPLPDRDLVEVLREVERGARMLAAVQHRLLIEVDIRKLPLDSGDKTVKRFLMNTLRLGSAEAGARVHAAFQVGTTFNLSGDAEDPQLPDTAAALRRGDISLDHVRGVAAVMKRVPRGVGMDEREAAEQLLAQLAVDGNPDDLGKLGDKILGYLDPDGRITDDTDRARMRGIRIGRQRADGMSPITGDLDPALRALLDAFLAKYARPGVANPQDPTSPGVDLDRADPGVIRAAAQRDTRTADQRTHDAVKLLLTDLVDRDRLGKHRGIPVTAILTMKLTDLEQLSGVATTATGGTIPIADALVLAETSRKYLAVFDHAGLPLHLGREKRLATADQRFALISALQGCSRPGCDAPAALCAVHHVKDYRKGGATDIENLVLACDHCHARITDTDEGWRTTVLAEDSEYPGRTAWIAPWHVDPTQTPKVNHRHNAAGLLGEALAAIHLRREEDRAAYHQWRQQEERESAEYRAHRLSESTAA
ncbi:HNH endonuclease signature motif containing protein [Nocardia alni]|uniref:HNH endonuclease signature motif containing protein n=1 Tax=Nocardia alni TaxID=2815723 RepID=UPI0020B311AC|nr:HNH endonuclease signature motif containing protein [Nocardia alni]